MIDTNLLRILKHRSEYQKIQSDIPRAAFSKETVALLDDFKIYFERFPEHSTVKMDVFAPMLKRLHPGMTDDMFKMYLSILRLVQQEADDCTRDGIMKDVYELSLGTALANIAEKYNEGDLEGSIAELASRELDKFKKNIGAKAAGWIDTDIGILLQDEINDAGLKWRLSCLRDHMRGLRGGDFILIAGRPDKGKTTLVASEVTHLAPQLPKDRNIIWLNNEGKGERIVPRLYQSALGVTMSTLSSLHADGKLVPKYRELIGGRLDKIRVHNIHGYSTGQVELIMEQSNPGVVVFDMIDHIRGFGDKARTDLVLEEMYKWAREQAVKHDCVCIATSQISNEGDNEAFPGMGMLKDSKTGKQGAADAQIMIGYVDTNPNARYIGIPKNKLKREGVPGDPRQEVMFQGDIARYGDIQEV